MNVISISVDAILSDMFCKHWKELPMSALKHIAKTIDYNTVPDGVITDNEEIRAIIRWDRLEKMKLIRILIRCIDHNVSDLDKIKKSIQQYEYRVNDLRFLFMRRPEFIEFFPIELNKISTTDAAMLLSFGSDYFLDKIDFSKHTFNFRESMNIIQGYKYDRNILEKVNYKSLKGYQVSEVLINTGERDLDLLDLSTLNSIDWVNLLESRPEMLKYCNYSKFMVGDIFYSIQLCCMFDTPDLSYLVIDRDMNTISPLGWQTLLIEKPEIFLAYCNFSKLDEISWNCILKSRPELHVYKPD
jgi:hypothetical protein